jgi:hypothetical protein
LVAQPQSNPGFEIAATLTLDRREPVPLWFEYIAADGGLATLSYMTRNSTRGVGLFKYDAQFRRQWGGQLYENNGRTDILSLEVLGNSILVFVSENFPREGLTKVFYYEYDLAGNRLADRELLHTEPNENRNLKRFRFERSPNKRTLVCFIEQAETDRPEQLSYYLFSADTDSLRQGQVRLPYPDRDFILRKVQVANTGTLYVLGKVAPGGRTRDAAQVRHVLIRHSPGTEALTEFPLAVQGGYITDLMFRLDREENILMGGFYSEVNAQNVGGVFYKRIEGATGTEAAQLNARLPQDIMARYLTPRQLERGRELSDFQLNHLIPRSDGGLLLLAEQFYITTTNYRDAYGFWYTRELYHYDDVLVLSLDSAGVLEWARPVPKAQAGEYPRELSYAFFLADDHIFIFHKNRLPGFGPNVYYNVVDFDGNISQPKPFFRRFRNTDVFYREASGQITNHAGMIVYYQSRGGLFTLMKLAF